MSTKDTAVARLPTTALTGPLPTMPSVDVVEALKAYRQIQQGLDHALGDDALVTIGDKRHRTKTYWNAIGTAFQLELELSREDYVRTGDPCEHCMNSEDWGYVVTVVATAPDGRKAFGDGACFASEKISYRWTWERYHDGKRQRFRKVDVLENGRPVIDVRATREARTVHNVRSTAITRARNRAVSNLVGFGEVSAEEMPRGGAQEPEPAEPDSSPPQEHAPSSDEPAATQDEYAQMEALWREKLPTLKYATLHRQALGCSPETIDGSSTTKRLSQSQMRVMLGYLRNYTAHERKPDESGSTDQSGARDADRESAAEDRSSAGAP